MRLISRLSRWQQFLIVVMVILTTLSAITTLFFDMPPNKIGMFGLYFYVLYTLLIVAFAKVKDDEDSVIVQIIDCWQLTRENLPKADSWIRLYSKDLMLVSQFGGDLIWVEIGKGDDKVIVEENDYIIRHADGSFRLCKKEDFEKTYRVITGGK